MPFGQTAPTPSLISVHDVKQPVETQVFLERERSPCGFHQASARAAPANRSATAGSYHKCGPRHRIETFPKTFHPRLDLVGGPKVEDEHVIVAPMNYFLQPARQFGTAARAEPALENRELQPAAVTVHQFEHTPPALVVADVVGHDIEPLFNHVCSALAPRNTLRYCVLQLRPPSSDEIVRIFVDLAVEVARQEPSLHFKQPPHRDAIAEHRMRHLLVETALVSLDESALGMRLEIDGRSR